MLEAKCWKSEIFVRKECRYDQLLSRDSPEGEVQAGGSRMSEIAEHVEMLRESIGRVSLLHES